MTDNFKEDAWIAANSQIAAEKLHALGVVTYRWNSAEVALKSLLIGVADVEFFKLWAIIHEMGDVAITAAMLEITKDNPQPKPVQELLEHALKPYDANRINRNQLTHFVGSSSVTSDLSRLKGPRFQPEAFADSVEDLRRVADDIANLLSYLSKLITVVYGQKYSKNLRELPPLLRSPLPDIIPLPERLWKPPLAGAPKRKSPPESFQG